jgi:hypothetical protein
MMHKITVTIACADGPLDVPVFDGEKVLEVEVNDPHDPEELLNKIEPEIIKIRGDSTVKIHLKAKTESGDTILEGSIDEGFHGTVMS